MPGPLDQQRSPSLAGEPEAEPVPEDVAEHAPGGGAGPEPAARRWVTGRMLNNMTQSELRKQCLKGFLFTPAARFDDGFLAGGCPERVRHCICQQILFGQTEDDPEIDLWEDPLPLWWKCSGCNQPVADTETWREIRCIHKHHECPVGMRGPG